MTATVRPPALRPRWTRPIPPAIGPSQQPVRPDGRRFVAGERLHGLHLSP
ncbi:hypothetical protein [Streptomyces griseofuscus]|nr:hypothetical protein [Streptomyces griseofuscus]